MDNPIRKAAENLKGNWYKGYYFNSRNHSKMCGIGHLQSAIFDKPLDLATNEALNDGERWNLYGEAYEIVNNTAGEQYPDRMKHSTFNFPNFNDHEDTTEDEVIAVLEKAAVRYDEKI